LEVPCIGTKAVEVLVNANEDLLGQVLRFVSPACVSVTEIVDAFAVHVHNRLPGGVVSLETTLYEFMIAGEHP
jgi:hypothetical protein